MGASPEFQEDPLRGRVQTVRWFRATPEALQPSEPDLLKVTDRGYQYGEGLFETLRTCSRRPVLLDAHLRRLSESARFLGIPLPSDLSAIPEALEQMLPDEDITIKIILSRGGAGRYAELDSHSLLSLQIFPYRPPEDEHYREGVTLHTVAAHRSATSPLHRHKTLNYLDSIMARREARSHDAYEALIINTDDFIAECSMSNIFFVLDGVVLTPTVESNVLRGITRDAILRLCRENDIPHDERLMNFADILFAQEVFITNSLIGVMPVREIDGKAFGNECPGPVTTRLSVLYNEKILAR
ncbi:MAG: hypothetical protein DRP79_04800 [Planctomycetota bacterium]|nr:MAG: hypothetical protein DRP79_04800 [Planctomycetota bacterium]